MVAPPSDGVPSQSHGSVKKPGRRKRPKSRATSGLGEADKTRPMPPIPRVAGPNATPRLLAVEPIDNGGTKSSVQSSVSVDIGEEERAIITEERPKLREALEEFRDRAQEVEEKISQLTMRASREAEEDEGPRDEGASFLGAKQILLMSYCQDLCSYAGGKVAGKSLKDGGTWSRLWELRTVMEKLRPLERKLKYQTDKLLRIAAIPVVEDAEGAVEGGGDGDDDPLSFRPRPEAMIPWRGETSPETGSPEGQRGERRVVKSADKERTSGLYRAPRISSMPYDEDTRGGSSSRERRQLEKSRQRVRRGEVMETLREEFGDQPEAVKGGAVNAGVSGITGAKLKKLAEDDRERAHFEEEHMVRLTMSRKRKKARARIEKDAGRLETIADVGSAADFVRVARDADGFARKAGYGKGDGNGDGGFGSKQKKSKSSGALTMAMGPVGRSMHGRSVHGAKGKRRRK